MNYPDELRRLVIRNMEVLETAPEVKDKVEYLLFDAINARIEGAVKAEKNWEGCYGLVTEKDDYMTTFKPQSWPNCKDKSEDYGACYNLKETADYQWLSCATGVKGASLCFEFCVDSRWSGLSAREHNRKLETFSADNAALLKTGFSLTTGRRKSIVRPFHFDADKLAEDYPDFDESLAPLDAALDDLFKAHGEFDNFVKKLKDGLLSPAP
jgi:hypothetical protein